MPRRRKRRPKPKPSAPLISEGTREQYIFLPLTLILCAYAYYTTLCPTVFVGDSGELAAASYYLGIPHSPGYPLYCLIGWLFAHMPIGDDIGFRLNLMSAVFAWGTVLVLYLIIYHFTRTPYISFSISLAYAFSPIFWSQAVVAEVYCLNTFLTALALYFLCRWLEKRTDYWLYLASITMGLAASNHQLAFLLLPTGLYMLYLFGKGLKKPLSFWLTLAGLYVLGLLVYLYLPIRAAADPPINWGDPDTFGRFFAVVFNPAGQQTTVGNRWDHFAHALYLWIVQFSPVVWIGEMAIPIPVIWLFGIWGIYKGLSTGWRMARVFVVFMALNLATILYFSQPTQQGLMIVGVYYLPVFLVFAVFMATGLREWLQNFQNVFKQSKRPTLSLLIILVIIILVLIPEYQYFQNRPEADRSDDYYARDYATSLLNACPPDAILVVNWDDIFTIWYLQKVEHLRTDVTPVLADLPTREGASFWGAWYFEELEQSDPELFQRSGVGRSTFRKREDAIDAFVTANLAQGKEVYFSFYGLGLDFGLFSFRVFPVGPVYRAQMDDYTIADLLQARTLWEKTLEEFRNPYTYLYTKVSINGEDKIAYRENRVVEEDFIISRMSLNLWNTAQVALPLVRELDLDREHVIWFLNQAVLLDRGNIPATLDLVRLYLEDGMYDDALNLLDDAREVDPFNPDVHLILARLYVLLGDPERALESIERVLELDPGDPEARALLESYTNN